MDEASARKLIERAVQLARPAGDEEEYEAVRELLREVAADGPVALRLGRALLDAPDPVVRATGCDLLSNASELHESVHQDVATTVLAIAARESDDHVCRSIARALGAAQDRRAVPVLVALADHTDEVVRLQVAVSLPSVATGEADGADVRTLIRLARDQDEEVRNWATFGLGFQLEVDTREIRDALWERVGDEHRDAREEAIRGLARRHDPRAIALIAELLDEDDAHVHTFYAAAILGAPELLPHLEAYEPDGHGVAEALAACDPAVRAQQDADAWALLLAVDERLPEARAALSADRFDTGLTLRVGAEGEYSVEALLARAGGDPAQAAALVHSGEVPA